MNVLLSSRSTPHTLPLAVLNLHLMVISEFMSDKSVAGLLELARELLGVCGSCGSGEGEPVGVRPWALEYGVP